MEYWELFDDKNEPLGLRVPRGTKLSLGEYYRVAGVICINRKGCILTTKRSRQKKTFPGYWEFTCGTVHPGENPLLAAVRELGEETGIKAGPEELKYLGTLKEADKFTYVYLHLCEEEKKDLVLQKEEVDRGEFLSRMFFLSKLYGDSYAPPMKERLVHFFQEYQEFLK